MKNKNSDLTVSNNSNQNLLYNFTKIFKMKKNLFSLLLSTIITSYAFGQITLEHSFDTGEQVLVYSDTETLKYITLLGTQINIYNSDYSLFKTFSISLPPTSSRVFLSTYDNFNFNVSKHLFNTDDKLEFFVFYQGSVGNLVVFNEDGNIAIKFSLSANSAQPDVSYIFSPSPPVPCNIHTNGTDEFPLYFVGMCKKYSLVTPSTTVVILNFPLTTGH